MPPPKTLIVVHCHASVLPAIRRHYDLWMSHGYEVVFTSPTDLGVSLPENRCVQLGLEAQCGPKSLDRFKKVWTWALDQGAERYVFFEYDSFFVTPGIPFWGDCMIANRFMEPDHCTFKHPFTSPIFYCAPWVMPRHILGEIVERFNQVPDTDYFDRYLGLLLCMHGIPHAGWGSLGFARVTDSPECHGVLRDAMRKGAIAMHGVKEQSAFDIIFEERKKYQQLNRHEHS